MNKFIDVYQCPMHEETEHENNVWTRLHYYDDDEGLKNIYKMTTRRERPNGDSLYCQHFFIDNTPETRAKFLVMANEAFDKRGES